MNLRRFRLLLPSSGYLVFYVAIYLIANVPMTQAGPNAPAGVLVNLSYPRRAVLILGLIAYGAYRAVGFHPYFRAGYRAWLETTPWTWRKPLPVGPVHPVWEDAVIVAAMSAPAWFFHDLPVLATYSIALGGYLSVLSMTFGRTGAWGFQYAVLLAVAAAIRLWELPAWSYTGMILLAAVLGRVGLVRSLKCWPWAVGSDVNPNNLENVFQNPGSFTTNRVDLGWPFDRLGPRRDPAPTWRDYLDALFQSLLVPCWLYALLGLIRDVQGRAAMGFMALLYCTIFALAYRISRYLAGYAPPIGLAARLGTFRLIVPSYDQVFLAPLTAMFAATAHPYFLYNAGIPPDAAMAISLALVLLALWLGGPDRRKWQLTAKHRVVPAITGQAKVKGGFVQVG